MIGLDQVLDSGSVNQNKDSRSVCFVFEREKGTKVYFLLGKGHPMIKLKIFTEAFQGHQGNNQGTGMEAFAFVASMKYLTCMPKCLDIIRLVCQLNPFRTGASYPNKVRKLPAMDSVGFETVMVLHNINSIKKESQTPFCKHIKMTESIDKSTTNFQPK